jgi:hypothetical protein
MNQMKCFTIFMLFLYGSQLNGQNRAANISNPYYECLKIYLKRLSEYGMYTPGDTVLIFKRDYLSGVSDSMENIKIKIVDDELLWKITRKRRAIGVLQIHPIDFKTGVSTIDIVDFGISRRGKHYTFTNNGFILIKYQLDCATGEIIYEIIDSH